MATKTLKGVQCSVEGICCIVAEVSRAGCSNAEEGQETGAEPGWLPPRHVEIFRAAGSTVGPAPTGVQAGAQQECGPSRRQRACSEWMM